MTFSGRVRIQDVLPYVPHRPPMVWVDEIISFSADAGECLIHIKENGLFLGPEGLRATSCLEFIAQSYGYCSVAYDHKVDPQARPLTKAFLASFKDVMFASPEHFNRVKVGDDVTTRFFGVRKVGAIAAFTGEAFHNEELLCRAQIKVFCET